jgi:hypothetical protein
MTDARQLLADADREIAVAERLLEQADRLLSIAAAAAWLQRQGVTAHVNTVRYWVKRGHLQSARTARGQVGVRASTLRAFAAHMQQCPFCQRHAQ